ncbi:hypothetical protein T484DRAFT_1904483, partial [Baffinella frigidus]
MGVGDFVKFAEREALIPGVASREAAVGVFDAVANDGKLNDAWRLGGALVGARGFAIAAGTLAALAWVPRLCGVAVGELLALKAGEDSAHKGEGSPDGRSHGAGGGARHPQTGYGEGAPPVTGWERMRTVSEAGALQAWMATLGSDEAFNAMANGQPLASPEQLEDLLRRA